MRNLCFIILAVFFTCVADDVVAQRCSGDGLDPSTAVAVCGTLTFPQASVPSCNGSDLPSSGCSSPVTSSNSVWYRFHCYQTGTLGFLIAPLSAADDYDWQLSNITGRAPADVFTTNLRVSLNLSAITGPTGCTPAGLLDINCAGGAAGSQFNRMPTVTAGSDYLLMVTNWSNSGLGYNLTFTGGTAVLTNNLPPTVSSVAIVGCNASTLKVTLSEDILCSSLTSSGSEFSIANTSATITGITSVCSSKNAVKEFTISLQNPLPAGNYNLVVNNGSDGNTLLDVCQTPLAAGSTIPFSIPAQAPVEIRQVMYFGCSPKVLNIKLTKPVLCSTIAPDGSDFSIPGNPVVALTSSCAGGATITDSVVLQFQNQLAPGNYQISIASGSDGNTLIDTCGVAAIAGSFFPFPVMQTTTPPVVSSIVLDDCKPFQAVVNFNKPVICSSLSASGSEFVITPGNITASNIIPQCAADGTTMQVLLTFPVNLPAGNLNLNIVNGSDGNTLSDSCSSFVPNGTRSPFTVNQLPAPKFDSLQWDKCAPASITVFYNKPIKCNSFNSNGSEFNITGPAGVVITGASGNTGCANGLTNAIVLTLSQPITTFGNYILHNVAGSDGNSVTDTCFVNQNTNETISFNVLGKPSATFNSQLNLGCKTDTLVLSHPGGNGVNSWQWKFSDGATATGQNVSHTFPATTATATAQLIVSNGICADTLLKTFTLGNAVSTSFTSSADTGCVKSTINFTNNTNGSNLQYQWQFGDNTQATTLSPAHAYTAAGSYTVRLVATNTQGCKDTTTKPVVVVAPPAAVISGLQPQYCTGDAVSLSATLQGIYTNYNWDNGDGRMLQNNPLFDFSYGNEGNFQASLTVSSRFCPDTIVRASTVVFAKPVVNLGEDKLLCPGLTTEIGVTAIPGYNYLWSDGSTTSRITSAPVTTRYELEVNNNGCTTRDDVLVTVLSNCLVKVPGAFTPNGDGLNDYLKAINSSLATNFLFEVYNRFGQLVFSSQDPLKGWDGRIKGLPAQAGTYVWQLKFNDPVTQQPIFEKGTSILIR